MKDSGDFTKDLSGLIGEALSPSGSRYSIRALTLSLAVPLVLLAFAFLLGFEYIVPESTDSGSVATELFRHQIEKNFILYFSTTFVCLVIFSLFVGVWLHRFVIEPLVKLRRYAEEMKTSKDLSRALPEQGATEIRSLTRAFNHLLIQIKQMEMELVSTSEVVNSSKYFALGEMAGGIAHEVNTPLATVMVNADLIDNYLDQDPLPMAEIKDHLEKTRKTVEQIAKVIRGLRTFARDASGLEAQDTQVSQIIDQALDLCLFRFRKSGIHIDYTPPSAEAVLHCNEVQIVQILVNLLNNAYDAVSELDEKKIVIKIDESSPQDLAISVLDNGSGVPEEIEEKVFQPFFSTKPVGNTGLGLSISLGIAHQHKGVLFCFREDDWTCFCLQLPRAANKQTSDSEAA